MTTVSDWDVAVELLEEMLEAAARILDGDAETHVPEPPPLDLAAAPDPAARTRVESLLTAMEQAMQALAQQRAHIDEELAQSSRLRTAGREYLRF